MYAIEYNPLAASALRRALQRDHTIRMFPHEQVFATPGASKSDAAVFVLDRGTLPGPLNNFLHSIRAKFPNARAIVLDQQCSREELVRLLFLGIHGFVPYSEVEHNLKRAVHVVSQGHYWVAQEVLERYMTYARPLSRPRSKEGSVPTQREKDIIQCIQRRFSNKEISSQLGISQSTVKFHLANVFAKLGVHDRSSVMEVVTSQLVG